MGSQHIAKYPKNERGEWAHSRIIHLTNLSENSVRRFSVPERNGQESSFQQPSNRIRCCRKIASLRNNAPRMHRRNQSRLPYPKWKFRKGGDQLQSTTGFRNYLIELKVSRALFYNRRFCPK